MKPSKTSIDFMRPELVNWLDSQPITSENIGQIRRRCFVPWDSQWNALVRDETAIRENGPHRLTCKTSPSEPIHVKNVPAEFYIETGPDTRLRIEVTRFWSFDGWGCRELSGEEGIKVLFPILTRGSRR